MLLAVACAGGERPAEPAWGKEPCAHCAMILSDRRFAAQSVDASGERRFFDDVGCMVLYGEEHGPPRRAWVRHADTGAWLEATAARYAAAAGAPMDFGFDANSDHGVSWSEMRGAVLAKERRARGW
jgi:copper chaperone NosL